MNDPKNQLSNLSDDALILVKALCFHFFNMGYAKACAEHKKKIPANPSDSLPPFTIAQFKQAISEL
jgi:hypothetical protein